MASTSNQQPAFKRIRLDAEGKELGTKGRSKIAGLDPAQKAKAIQFIWMLAKPLYQKAGIDLFNPDTVVDLGLDCQIVNTIFSLHQAERQQMNQANGANASRKFFAQAGVTIAAHGTTVTFPMTGLRDTYREALAACEFTATNRESWGGNVQTLLALFSMISERLKEIRIMPVGMVTTKGVENGQSYVKTMDFKSLGVMPQHRQLCSGAAWRPFIKGALAQSLGPLTQACMLVMAQDNKFATKWETAVRRTFSYIPDIEHISRIMRTHTPQECSGIILRLANIAMIIGGREQRRVSLPFAGWMYLFTKQGMTEGTSDPVWEFEAEMALSYDFSGKGAFCAYNALTVNGPRFTLNIANQHYSEQILFHACFGTHVEDFGVLSFMTGNKDWATRREIDPVFVTARNTAPPLDNAAAHRLPPVQFYSKMASATLLKEAAMTTKATNACMQFSGLRTRKFTSEMKETLERDQGRTTFTHSVQGAEAALAAYFYHVRSILDDKDYNAGNVKWRKIAGLTLQQHGPEVEDRPKETGKIFWSN